MITLHTFKNAHFQVGIQKTEHVDVTFEVLTPNDDDEFAISMDDGIHEAQLRGEMEVDVYFDDVKYKSGTVGTLSLSADQSSKFHIVLFDRIDSKTITPQKHKKHVWLFQAVGRPIYDRLGLFPEVFRMAILKVYTVTDFQGHSFLPVASVVVAKNQEEARQLMDEKLLAANLMSKQEFEYTLEEVNVTQPSATILVDGSEF